MSDHPLSEVFVIFKYNFLHFSSCPLTESPSEPFLFQAKQPQASQPLLSTKYPNTFILTLPLTHSSMSTSLVHWEVSTGHSTSDVSQQC